MIRHVFLFLAGISVLLACRSGHHSYEPVPQEKTEADPQLVFLTFRIHADSISKKNTITFLNAKRAAGRIKSPTPKLVASEQLVITILDQSKSPLIAEAVEHPLLRVVEVSTEKGELSRKTVNLKDAEFFVRMKLPPGAAWISIVEIIDHKPLSPVEFSLN